MTQDLSGDPVLDSRPRAAAEPPPRLPDSLALDSVVRPPPPAAPVPGQRLGDYELLDPIGAGGFSLVVSARHVPSGEVVAIKLPRVAEFVGHLRREALIASRFRDPQVVGIREVHLEHDPPFLVMPRISGANLELPDAAPAPRRIEWAFRRFRAVVEVVARLHAAGIAHGDLKPGNVRFDPAGVCHILDLGVARHQVAARQLSTLRNSVVSVTGERIAGTLEFMAPEVMSGAPPGKAADVYALGVILHHLLCGRPPAFGVSPTALNPYLPPRTADFLRQMLQSDPGRRPADAGALLPDVDAFVRAELRCLGRRNGHARRRVFMERMHTLARGARLLAWPVATVLVVLLLAAVAPQLDPDMVSGTLVALTIPIAVLSAVGGLLGMTTINAWILGVPEKTYKNRRGHPLWTFMMQ